ncbi:MAG TPA: penicillin-binding protein 2 [Hydrogenophilus thermoluteolus]|nr:cell division protein [Rhodocyclaceae bacterium]HNQ48748.1 penicillin-binding protein 2 [Hydrogenophilus thermoluteolus]HNU19098.1 penicillin-binding protein 2 [Hydrogenophilus thermoluteolus]
MTHDLAVGTFRLAVPLPRLVFVLSLFGLCVALVVGRAGWLVAAESQFLQAQAEQRYERVVTVPAARGRLLDRNGTILAQSVETHSIWVDPQLWQAASSEQVEALARLLGTTPDAIEAQIARGGSRFAYLKRHLDRRTAEAVLALKIPGVSALQEPKRVYPYRELVATVVGITDIDGNGLEGLERGFDNRLQGHPGKKVLVQDRQGRPVREGEWLVPVQSGEDLILSLDLRIQAAALNAVKDTVTQFQAKGGAAVVLDAKSGEVLAMANWPTFDPEARTELDWNLVRNRAITDSYEPGSVVKPILVALGLEQNVVRPETPIDVRGGVIKVSGFSIRDAHASDRVLTVSEVIQKSSNVGVVKIAQKLDPQALWQHYRRFGFGERPKIPLKGATAGHLFPPQHLKPIEVATMAFGHGMSASLLQVAGAYQALANDGCRLPITFVRLESLPSCSQHQRVVSARTARTVRAMLEKVTDVGGTGTRAQVAGYTTAGKTGTARKVENGQYVQKYVASFVGYAPATDPRIVVAVMVDEPNVQKGYYGGTVAAPAFAEIVRQALPALGVLPDQPVQVVAESRAPRG